MVWDQELRPHQLMLIRLGGLVPSISEEKVGGILECSINFQFHRLRAGRLVDQLDRPQSSPTQLQQKVEQLQQLKPHICKPRAPGQRRRARSSKTEKYFMKRKLNKKGPFKIQEASQP